MSKLSPPCREQPLGLIAGSGQFPIWVARAAKADGRTIHAVAVEGWTDRALEEATDSCAWIRLGQLSKLLRVLQHHQIATATLAGKITKEALLKHLHTLDIEMIKTMARTRGDMRVNTLLGALESRLQEIGVTLVDATQFLHDWIPVAGVLTQRKPSRVMLQDIELGQSVATALAGYDVGQTVVVQRGVVLAVEASEATDAAIRRGASYGGPGIVVVKMARPNQDMRFDVPVIGPDTIATMRDVDAACIAVEAGRTLLLERDRLTAHANEHSLIVTAV